MRSTKARPATLVLCLVVLALLLGTLSSGLAAPFSQVFQRLPPASSSPKTVHTLGIETGAILVNASFSVDGFGAVPIQNATVEILRSVQGSYPLLLQTNSSGEVQWPLVAGNYTLTVSDRLFSVVAPVQIHQNSTTRDDLTVRKLSDQVVFSDLSDEDYAGSVAPWQSATLAVTGTSALANNGSYFLDLFYDNADTGGLAPPGTSIIQEELVSVTMLSSQVGGSGSSSVLWLTLRPEAFVPVQGIRSLSLVTFDAVTRISYHGY